jgi:succinate dehydrogenase flavin-adding protein (antitoxin of CptAB toxin-antitoxin module)
MNDAEMNRLRWHCRRGLLENDLVLERFLAVHGAELEGERLSAFETLLGYADDELWGIVSGQAECRDPALGEVVRLLRSC